jgi:hypothetical protein
VVVVVSAVCAEIGVAGMDIADVSSNRLGMYDLFSLIRESKEESCGGWQRRAGSDNPQWKISPTEWSTVLSRLEQSESLCKVAKDYGVSYETVRRIILAATKEHVQR